jgi:hypothetical protein
MLGRVREPVLLEVWLEPLLARAPFALFVLVLGAADCPVGLCALFAAGVLLATALLLALVAGVAGDVDPLGLIGGLLLATAPFELLAPGPVPLLPSGRVELLESVDGVLLAT